MSQKQKKSSHRKSVSVTTVHACNTRCHEHSCVELTYINSSPSQLHEMSHDFEPVILTET